MLLLANLDLVMARHLLPGEASGRYGAGAVLAKAAFWLPQAVAVVVFPRLAEPEAGVALLRRAVALVGGLGLLAVLGSLVLAGPVLRLSFGPGYAALSGTAWVWVTQGVLASVVQLLVYHGIATHDPRPAQLVGAAAVVEGAVLLLWRPESTTEVVTTAALTGAVAVLVLSARQLRR